MYTIIITIQAQAAAAQQPTARKQLTAAAAPRRAGFTCCTHGSASG